MEKVLFDLLPFFLIFFVFYFLVIKPKQDQEKKHVAMIAAVKKGDEVTTIGGLIGKVSKVSDEEVIIDFCDNVNIRAVKTRLIDVKP